MFERPSFCGNCGAGIGDAEQVFCHACGQRLFAIAMPELALEPEPAPELEPAPAVANEAPRPEPEPQPAPEPEPEPAPEPAPEPQPIAGAVGVPMPVGRPRTSVIAVAVGALAAGVALVFLVVFVALPLLRPLYVVPLVVAPGGSLQSVGTTAAVPEGARVSLRFYAVGGPFTVRVASETAGGATWTSGPISGAASGIDLQPLELPAGRYLVNVGTLPGAITIAVGDAAK